MASYFHAPRDYQCPFCAIVAGKDRPGLGTKQADIVWHSDRVTVFVATRWWPRNQGHVLVIPNPHFENIFDLPPVWGTDIQQAAQMAARAMKAVYGCPGISTRQHNEPAGSQDVWHYHLHVYPRYEDDNFYASTGYQTQPEDRIRYAAELREWIIKDEAASR